VSHIKKEVPSKEVAAP